MQPSSPALSRRADWTAYADRLLAAAHRHASPSHALITLPGTEGGHGRAVDGLEGFARTFLLAGFRLAGDQGRDLESLAERYAAGLAAGTDPGSPERWVRLTEHPQAKVEAASIALILDMTRPWIWDRLDPVVREHVVDYLSPAVGDDTYPRINWVWFRLVVQTFLRSVGGPFSTTEMAADLATHDTFRRADGWLSDGSSRAYDHYTGWALHLYPVLWSRMSGAPPLRPADREALDRFLFDALALTGGDGSPLVQGRSLIYRFAAAAPFWAGVLADVPSHPPGRLRQAAARIVGHFPLRDDLLTLGWHGPWPRLAQSYSGPGSPYWASKGLLGVALPADHPVWAAPAEPLPVETGDVLRAVRAPGWLISGTRADGIVRVINHGTDHGTEGVPGADSPLYARLGYSTATAPVLDESGWTDPLDQSVVLVDPAGRRSHRTGMRALGVHLQEGVGVGGSITEAHWLEPGPPARDHGQGRPGKLRPAGRITVFSLVRGPWEIRLVRVADAAAEAVRLRIGGWPVTGTLVSALIPVVGDGTPGVSEHDDAGPLGGPVRVPWLDFPIGDGWIAVLTELTTSEIPPRCHVDIRGGQVRAVWPDAVRTHTRIDIEE
ncbi:DUF2264 domain-containing protein [Actinoplanes utahensis]|uniref:DUF2264 domain-containing protein n=1 Tax=Actinoplanes utahensis TaxID=1869 RepID=A0A0A6UPY9_ACTUT|nr:DUF2264 domain-containing protein [Actinoplanes utahensis]KHD78200.1 hypothetical protein MB27_07090 [Actinoplanes utahensis]GIF30717.1 hypothetical protein Aut01nite_37030 [Actinoplanes utahensis]